MRSEREAAAVVPEMPMERAAPIERTIKQRRSVRRFLQKPVATDLLERLVDLARWAPSPHNAQPWRFAMVIRQESRVRLAAAMGARFRHDLLHDGLPEEIVEIRVRTSIERLIEAPALVLVCMAPDGLHTYPDARRQDMERTMAAQSVGAAVQNLLLTADSLGLGACWICAPLFCPEVVSAALDLDPAWQPQALVLIGYPVRRPEAPQRRSIDSLVTYR